MSAREEKYDRQIRLWAHAGQARLAQAHICLINANAAGTETLKNLVLPGVGAFTVLDDRTVTESDLSGNFFIENEHLGINIARATAECLQELNPDVKGSYSEWSPEKALESPAWWARFTTVVVSGYTPPELLERLKAVLWDLSIPLLFIATSGFYASLTVLARETTIVETHDPSKTYDLRIDCPWPELYQYCASFDMDSLDDTEHAHVPYIVIFIKALDKWKLDHGGIAPSNYAEKRKFRSNYIEKMSRNISLETNFIEASQSVHRALQITSVPSSVQQMLSRSECLEIGAQTPEFWLYVRALSLFLDVNDGKLPLPGNIPDMASTTSNYVQLQAIYRQKAERDKARFITELKKVFAQAGKLQEEIDQDLVASFCKNAAFLYATNGSNDLVSQSLTRQLKALIVGDSENAAHNELAIYFGMLALHKWLSSGKCGGFSSFVDCFKQVARVSGDEITASVVSTLKEIFTHDVEGYHNICSLIGGIAGQEALKIATAQYIPLDNLYIFDGVRSTSSKWKI
ncbi:hypothetical protein OXX59_003881 [Metschnikowia pulcherrima]